MQLNPLLTTDGYKTFHHLMYAPGTTQVYSNYTCRNLKYMPKGAKDVVAFGMQYVFKYIHDLWKTNFFDIDKDIVCEEAKNYLSVYSGTNYDVSHFKALHDLGYLPIEVKALKEGFITTSGIPLFTIKNTRPEQFWLTNFLETCISTLIWKPVHSASLALAYKKILIKYAKETDIANLWFVDYQGHDFSFRGMQSPDAAISSGLGFVTSFKGSDTIPVMQAADYYYDARFNSICSVAATEHSVMCSGSKEGEIETFRRLMKTFPKGILSVVSDTWDLWKVLTEYLPELKEEILARDGKLVIRPDSGDPVDIICGVKDTVVKISISDEYFSDFMLDLEMYDNEIICIDGNYYYVEGVEDFIREYGQDQWSQINKTNMDDMVYGGRCGVLRPINNPNNYSVHQIKGLIELLWDTFGGTINEQGYKVLDPHIGAIYGDSITLERAEQICDRLKQKGFASTNIVLGIGSFSMGYATRDQQGGAVKSTYVEINGEGIEIFKDPVTDDGTKKSAKGLLKVYTDNGKLKVKDCCSKEEESQGLLKTIFKDGIFYEQTTLEEIRSFINITSI